MTPHAPPTVTVHALAASFSLPTYSGVIVSHPQRVHLVRAQKQQSSSSKDKVFAAKAPKSKKQCSNCFKRGDVKADCWTKGGGKEG